MHIDKIHWNFDSLETLYWVFTQVSFEILGPKNTIEPNHFVNFFGIIVSNTQCEGLEILSNLIDKSDHRPHCANFLRLHQILLGIKDYVNFDHCVFGGQHFKRSHYIFMPLRVMRSVEWQSSRSNKRSKWTIVLNTMGHKS